MIEIAVALASLYTGYRLFRKKGEKFFYED
ncbi:Uncharacterised protein [Bacteroides intestinalis]|uniref:Uncharacterized protein n=1 Tax=Bacteroides intestinalis TaxID=329854 RepID=A0A6N2XIK9_9BACE|nr:MAG TPA: FeoB-associated Cys-rich membrane protein [Caudoviricetes sp.]